MIVIQVYKVALALLLCVALGSLIKPPLNDCYSTLVG